MQFIWLLIIIIGIRALNNETAIIDGGSYRSEKKRCCQIQYQPHIIAIEPLSIRKLATSSTHKFKIKPQWPSESTIDINVVQRMFNISTKYYERIITVTSLQQNETFFSGSSGKCGRAVPSQYITQGFNPQQTDSVIIITTSNDPNSGVIASAMACILSRWPTYGNINFNAAETQTDINKTGYFHQNVIIAVIFSQSSQIHQMCHIYGLSVNLFNHYYTQYGSGQYQTNVVGTINGQLMIITPNVLNYVQNFFDCHDGVTGALLENDGGSGTVNSHWERTIYLDQFMTASSLAQGSIITALTLNLLKDTNYYYDIDVDYSEPVKFGEKAGCNFAKGISTKTPQYCFTSQNKCDFYGFFGGFCGIDTYSSRGFIVPFANKVCTLPQSPHSTTKYQVYDALSHCFNVLSSGSNCFLAKCQGQQIILTINGVNYDCNSNSTIQTSIGSVQCPDSQIFCARKKCENWCNAESICILGQCMGEQNPSFKNTQNNNNNTVIIAVCVSIGVFILIVIFIVLICIYCKFKKNEITDITEEIEDEDIAEKKKSKQNKQKKKNDNNKVKDKVFQNPSENSMANIKLNKQGRQILPPISRENSNNRIYNPYSKFKKPQYPPYLR